MEEKWRKEKKGKGEEMKKAYRKME